MEGYFPLKTKRKDLEDDFSDFSLSSPARKIRRLYADLPPIIEEKNCEIPVNFERSVPGNHSFDSDSDLKIEKLPSENEERDIVLFNSKNSPLLQSPSNLSVSVHPDLISGIKNQVLWSNQSDTWRLANEACTSNWNLAIVPYAPPVVPYAPPVVPSAPEVQHSPEVDKLESMDSEETDVEAMEVEDETRVDRRGVNETGEYFHQWQQQHCLIPQPPYTATAPLIWYG